MELHGFPVAVWSQNLPYICNHPLPDGSFSSPGLWEKVSADRRRWHRCRRWWSSGAADSAPGMEAGLGRAQQSSPGDRASLAQGPTAWKVAGPLRGLVITRPGWERGLGQSNHTQPTQFGSAAKDSSASRADAGAEPPLTSRPTIPKWHQVQSRTAGTICLRKVLVVLREGP